MSDNSNMPEAGVIVFTEYRKLAPGTTDEYASYHVTVREALDDETALKRLLWWDEQLTQMGFTHADAPRKMNYPPRGSGGGKGKPADVPESGRFQVKGLAIWTYNNAKQIKIHGVNGEQVTDWGGKKTDALMKSIPDQAAAKWLTGWGDDWKEGDIQNVPWEKHKLFVQCEKSSKTDKNGKPYWDVKEFVIE